MAVIRRDGTRGPGDRSTHSIERGVGYCITRSRHHMKRLGHLFVCKQTVNGVTSDHCAWCWKRLT